MEEGEICASCGDQCGCSWQLELSIDLGFGFYWVRVSFFFSSDSRARAELGKSREQHARKFLPARLFL